MKQKTKLSVSIAVAVFLGILTVAFFYSASRAYLRSICNAELEDYALANAVTTKAEMENALQITQTACESFTEIENYNSDNALNMLRILAHNSSFAYMVLSDSEGRGINSKGSRVDATTFASYQRTKYGEKVIDSMDVDGDQQDEIVMSAPILSHGKVKGMLFGIYETFDMSNVINVESFGGRGYAILMDTKGNIIIPDSNPNCLNTAEENYWDYFSKVSFGKGYSNLKIQSDVQKGLSGIAMYSKDGSQRELYYTPLGLNHWYLLQMVTGDVITDYTAPMNHRVLLLVSVLGLLCIWLGVIVHRYLEHTRRARAVEAERFRSLAENIPGGVAEFEMGKELTISFANEGFYQIMGWTKEEMLHPLEFLCETDAAEITERMKKQILRDCSVYQECRIRRKAGDIRWISMTGKVSHESHGISFIQAIVSDITQQKQAAAEILDNARRDKMTHLYDKVSATEIITRELQQTQMGGVNALLVIDIDDFKQVNDNYGHQMGDTVIIHVAETIQNSFKQTDTVGRIGGDEFIVMMRDVTDVAHVWKRADEFLHNITKMKFREAGVNVSCSIGGVVFTMRKSHVFGDVFGQADENLYVVKKEGKGKSNIHDLKEVYTDEKMEDTSTF